MPEEQPRASAAGAWRLKRLIGAGAVGEKAVVVAGALQAALLVLYSGPPCPAAAHNVVPPSAKKDSKDDPPHTHTHSHTHILTRTHTLTHTLTHSHTYTYHAHTPHTLPAALRLLPSGGAHAAEQPRRPLHTDDSAARQ